MDIGNMPIYTNKPQQHTQQDQPKSRAMSSIPPPVQQQPKNAWDEIGDYEEEPYTGPNNDDDEEEEKEQPETPTPAKTPSKKEKQESDDAASIASQAAVKESLKNQLQK